MNESVETREFDKRFEFISFGVRIAVESDQQDMLDKARVLVDKAFGGRAKFFEPTTGSVAYTFGIHWEDGRFHLYENGDVVAAGESERNFFKFLNSAFRLQVAEHAVGHVFVHAGVVSRDGLAILLPGISFSGKSTLTAELVRNGAVYYSDEYAVLRADGHVVPFPRHLSLRDQTGHETMVPASELGGEVGRKAVPVGMIFFTRFSEAADIAPEYLSPGAGIMEIIPNTLTIRKDPAFSLKVLELVAQRAIMVRSPRGDVNSFAKFLLEFFDINTKLSRVT